jgi:hypothetical protein
VTYNQFKKNTKNKSENNHTKSEKKKKTSSQQDLSQTHTMGLVGPDRDLPQTLPVLNHLKICFNAQKPISNA